MKVLEEGESKKIKIMFYVQEMQRKSHRTMCIEALQILWQKSTPKNTPLCYRSLNAAFNKSTPKSTLKYYLASF